MLCPACERLLPGIGKHHCPGGEVWEDLDVRSDCEGVRRRFRVVAAGGRGPLAWVKVKNLTGRSPGRIVKLMRARLKSNDAGTRGYRRVS